MTFFSLYYIILKLGQTGCNDDESFTHNSLTSAVVFENRSFLSPVTLYLYPSSKSNFGEKKYSESFVTFMGFVSFFSLVRVE